MSQPPSAEAIAQAVARISDLADAMEGGISETRVLDADAAVKQAWYVAALRLLLTLAADYVPAQDRERAKHLYLGAVMTRIEAGGYSAAAHQTMTLADRLLKLEPPESQP